MLNFDLKKVQHRNVVCNKLFAMFEKKRQFLLLLALVYCKLLSLMTVLDYKINKHKFVQKVAKDCIHKHSARL